MEELPKPYGAPMATGSFDPITFIKKPHVVLRLVSLLFAIITFGCILSGGYAYKDDGGQVCLYAGSGACGYGVAFGILAFFACIGFLALDAYFDNISSADVRKKVVLLDLGTSAFFAFFFFVGFCYLTNQWNKASKDKMTSLGISNDFDYNRPQAAIAFSFFSIFSWAALAFFAWKRYQEGAASAFAPSYDQEFGNSGVPPYGYPGGPTAGGTESYQEPPFTSSADVPNAGPQYKPPAY